MESYSSYKDSGVEWIGKIPSHWNLGKFNFYIELKHGHQFRDNDFTDEGIPIVKMSQLNKNGKLNLNNCSTISSERIQEFNDNIINNGDMMKSNASTNINKKNKFYNILQKTLIDYRNKDIDFYIKLENKNVRNKIFDNIYEEYLKLH